MSTDRGRVYSDLEAVPHQVRHCTDLTTRPLPTDLGLHVTPDDGKQLSSDSPGLVPVIGEEAVENDGAGALSIGNSLRAKITRPAKGIWILSALLILVLGAILGTVYGLRRERSGTAPAAQNASSISVATPNRNIAAFSFTEGSIINTHVFFQDNVGQIIESANSASNSTWVISKTGFSGKNGSAISAIVSRPNFPLEFRVIYLDINNFICDIIYNPSTKVWSSGTLSEKGYEAMPNSSLAATYNQCQLCANTTLIAFQDENGYIQIGNLTSSGWTLVQLSPFIDSVPGTGLALHPFYRSGLKDQINLFHQKSSLNMSLSSWKPAAANNGVDGWSLNEQEYSIIPLGSSIGAASSYSNVSTGYETWIEVLFQSASGIRTSAWSGASDDWIENGVQPSAMANSTSNPKTYGGVAVTAVGNAFGVVMEEGRADTIQSWTLQANLLDWSSNGTVDLGGAWG